MPRCWRNWAARGPAPGAARPGRAARPRPRPRAGRRAKAAVSRLPSPRGVSVGASAAQMLTAPPVAAMMHPSRRPGGRRASLEFTTLMGDTIGLNGGQIVTFLRKRDYVFVRELRRRARVVAQCSFTTIRFGSISSARNTSHFTSPSAQSFLRTLPRDQTAARGPPRERGQVVQLLSVPGQLDWLSPNGVCRQCGNQPIRCGSSGED